jgi:aspergillopepsin I
MLLTPAFLLTASLLTPHAIDAFQVKVSTPSAFQTASANSVTSNVLTLTKQSSSKAYNPRSAAWLLKKPVPFATGHSTTLISLGIGEEFATTVTFGTETFVAIVDTGSSDTWIAETGFQCANITNSAPLPEADCNFGPTYNVTDTFKQIPDENFNITYGGGEFLTGIVGTEEVTLAGLTVKQEVALVNYAAWEGDGTTSGLIGLAYPAL